MPTKSQAFYCNFLSVAFLFSYCRGSFRHYLSAKMAFTITLAILSMK